MISRRTIYVLLVTLLLGGVVFAWSEGRRDECSAWLAGDVHAPRTMVVMTGEHPMVVGCDEWFLRQSAGVQVGWLVVLGGLGVFGLSAWADWRLRRGLAG